MTNITGLVWKGWNGGGHILGQPGRIRADMTATHRTDSSIFLPVGPANRRGDFHTHLTPPSRQGPSIDDSLGIATIWRKPHIVESQDSLFLIMPVGPDQARAVGCAK